MNLIWVDTALKNILQHLEWMKNNKYFSIEYEMNRGCSTKNSTPPENIKEYFSPSINFNEEYIVQYNKHIY